MASWVAAARKLSQSAKLSLFLGDGPPVSYLVEQLTARFDRTLFLIPPIGPDDLATTIGMPSETQATVIGPVDQLDEAGWDLLVRYLAPAKLPGTTLVLTGERLPDHPAAQKVKDLAGRGKNVYAQATSPTGAKGRDELIEWVAETWSIYPHDADYACARADFDLTAIVWATRAFLALSKGKPVVGERARAMINVAVPASPLTDAYTMIMGRSRDAIHAVLGFTPEQTLGLLRMLERGITDMERIRPFLSESTGKIVRESGVHVVRVKELTRLLPLYSTDTLTRCREVLALGFSHWLEPEAAETVALLWA